MKHFLCVLPYLSKHSGVLRYTELFSHIDFFLAKRLSTNASEFKKDLSIVISLIDESIFTDRFNILVEKCAEKMKNEDDTSSFRTYMADLFNIRPKWAYYYTHQFFSVASQSTQRNEGINGVIKRYLVELNSFV